MGRKHSRASVMARAESAMRKYLPKTRTYVKSDGKKPITVKVVPGRKSRSQPTSSSRKARKEVRKAKDMRRAAMKAAAMAKGGAAKKAAKKMVKKAAKMVAKARLDKAIANTKKSAAKAGKAPPRKGGLTDPRIKPAQN